MRTTINIDDDVLDQAHHMAKEMRVPFRVVVNSALRKGLDQTKEAGKKRKYTTKSREMGLKQGYNLDNIQELLAQAEGEDFR